MKKKMIILSILTIAFAFISANPFEESKYAKKLSRMDVDNEIISTEFKIAIPEIDIEEKIKRLYDDFVLANSSMPSLVSFQNAMRGYYQLLENGKIENKILTIVDFSLASTEKRMWVLDMASNSVLFNTLVAHGKGTGANMAKNFSNVANSHKSSLGFFLTAETYIGKHGLSMRMDGLEKGINDNARSRYIVVHGADYATSDFVKRVGRLGRSFGCPAVPSKFSKEIINTIKEKSCFFIYYPSEKYFEASEFLNTKKA